MGKRLSEQAAGKAGAASTTGRSNARPSLGFSENMKLKARPMLELLRCGSCGATLPPVRVDRCPSCQAHLYRFSPKPTTVDLDTSSRSAAAKGHSKQSLPVG